jgi:ATP-dependent Lon protease
MRPTPPTVLHVLPLPHPHILLPGNRLTLSISRETGDELLALIDEHEDTQADGRRTRGKTKPFLIAAVPAVPSPASTTPTETGTPTPSIQGRDYLPPIQPQPPSTPNPTSDSHPHLSEWGTSAQILSLVKTRPSTRTEKIGEHGPLTVVRRAPTTSYLVSLQGLTRIKLVGPSNSTPSLSFTALPLFTISHASASPPDSEQFESESLIKFKQSALTLLDTLARDSVQKVKREAYTRVAEMLDDLDTHSSSSESLSRAAWMVDVLVGNIINDYNDKLGKFLSFRFVILFRQPYSYIMHAVPQHYLIRTRFSDIHKICIYNGRIPKDCLGS